MRRLALLALFACAPGGEFDRRSGGCPAGWYEAAHVACADGRQRTSHVFFGTACESCQPSRVTCGGDWRPLDAQFACGPGFELCYDRAGTCKRCRAASARDLLSAR